MKSVHMKGLGFVALLTIFILVLAACIQPTPPPGSAAAAVEAAPTEAPAEAAGGGDAAAGGYIASVIGCGCHFNQDLGGMAGGRAFEGDFGVVYASNVTSDPETGIGNWTAEQLVTVLRTGARPDGTQLHGTMPYRGLSGLSDQDAMNVAAFLLSLPPIVNDVPERELKEEPAAFAPANPAPAESPSAPAERGAYLLAVTRCAGGCHMPRNEDGSPKQDMLLAGNKLQDDVVAPNLTPAGSTADWTEQDIANYMRTGKRPDGTDAQDPMASQINNRFKNLSEEDALAIAAYLKSLPPVENDPSK